MLLTHKLSQIITFLAASLFISSSFATIYDMPTPGNDVVGQNLLISAKKDDTLLTIGNRYDIGPREMIAANPVLRRNEQTAAKFLYPGTKVILPLQHILPPFRAGIVINLAELRLYYFSPNGKYVYAYPVGLGRMNWRTPLSATRIIKKQEEPAWHVPKSIHDYVLAKTGQNLPDILPPGPNNPLGHYAIFLGIPGYLIHGTNQPWSVGRYVSSGCIRMHNDDVEELFSMVTVGTPVRIVNYTSKAGWVDNQLYLESHIPIDVDDPNSPLNVDSVEIVLNEATLATPAIVDMNKVAQVTTDHTGLPTLIGVAATQYPQQASLEINHKSTPP